jgi:hypothetical protein
MWFPGLSSIRTSIIMEKSSPINLSNRRAYPRHMLPYLLSTDEGWGMLERLNNISLCGCSISTPQIYAEGEHVLLHFKEPDDSPAADRTFCLDGCVVWSKTNEQNHNTYGMRFQPNCGDFLHHEMTTFQKSFQDHLQIQSEASPGGK